MAVRIPRQERLQSRNASPRQAHGLGYEQVWVIQLQTLEAIPWQGYRSNIYTKLKHNFVKAFAQIKNFVFPCYYL